MVAILEYVLLGILIYVVGIPVFEELATIIVQGLEVFKGKMIVSLTKLQNEADKLKNEITAEQSTHIIGYTIPEDDEEYEEEDEEDDN